MKEWGVKFDLPEHLAEKAASFPESSYGATILTLDPGFERRNACPARSRGLGTECYQSDWRRRGVSPLHAKPYGNRGCLARAMKA